MTNLTTVTLVSGAPTDFGTVSTIDNLMALIGTPNPNGATAGSASAPIIPATDWVGSTGWSKVTTGYHVTIAASASGTAIQSSTGATGDFISSIVVIPGTTSPGNVILTDGTASTTIFTGGFASVSNLVPFTIGINAVSRNGAWSATTGANVSIFVVGKLS